MIPKKSLLGGGSLQKYRSLGVGLAALKISDWSSTQSILFQPFQHLLLLIFLFTLIVHLGSGQRYKPMFTCTVPEYRLHLIT